MAGSSITRGCGKDWRRRKIALADKEFAAVNICGGLDNKIEWSGDVNPHRDAAAFSSIGRHVETFLKSGAEGFARQRN